MSELGEHLYAEVTANERWRIDGEPRRIESISGAGWSEASRKDSRLEYSASDLFDGARKEIEQRLRSALRIDHALIIDAVRVLESPVEVRIFTKARYAESEHATNLDTRTTVTVATESAAIVARPQTLVADLESLRLPKREKKADETIDAHEYPIVWRRGSGAILLHEAIGHPAERSSPSIEWPAWLDVVDDPLSDGLGTMSVDDAGRPTRAARLKMEPPHAFRRESFRDMPLRRMTNLIVTATAAAPLPDPRIEVGLVANGGFDPLTEIASLSIAAATFVDGGSIRSLAPFGIRIDRKTLAVRLLGSTSATTAYPGMICFDEGQRLPVGSAAPDFVTAPFEGR